MENQPQAKAKDDGLVMSLVELALGQPSGQREDYLRTACGDDTELFDLVTEYVQAEERMQGFLLEPLVPPEQPEHPLEPGILVVNRFQILREVGRGGMGIVYEAHDQKLDRRIAIKVPKSEFRKRLPREVRNAREIAHPHVCRIFEIHTTPVKGSETDFMTMEFLEGETLAVRLAKGPLPEAEARVIAQQICEGLAEAHRRRVIHGDLKSNNIILTKTPEGGARAVIMDFGLARKPGSLLPSMMSATRGGTEAYMAPELSQGERPSIASDIYALGVILHELATGQRPIRPGSAEERRANSSYARVVPGWTGVLARCLHPTPARRFAAVEEVGAALVAPSHRRFAGAAAAAAVVAAAGITWAYWQGSTVEGMPSVAVIPFSNTDGTPEAKYWSDGISESLISALAQLPDLKVIASNSSFRFSAGSLDVREAAKMLGVRTLVTGRVQESNGRLRVSAQLINGGDGGVIWGDEYHPNVAELTYVQAQIAGEIAQRVRSKLSQVEQTRLTKSGNANPRAYALFMQGRSQMRLYTPDSSQRAAQYFEQAVALDPGFALAHAELANTYRRLGGAGIRQVADSIARAEKAARQALAAGGDLAEAHAVFADIKKDQWDWSAAEREYRRALELSPSLVSAREGLAICLSVLGRYDEAVAEILRARDLDPVGLSNAIDGAAVFYNARRYDEAMESLKRATSLDGSAPALWTWIGIVNGGKGDFRAAMEAFDRAIQMGDHTPATLCYYVYALARSGQRGQAERLLDSVQRSNDFIPPSSLAIAYTGLGQKRRAMDLLESAYEARDPLLQYITAESHFEALYSEQRFQQLAAKLGLPMPPKETHER